MPCGYRPAGCVLSLGTVTEPAPTFPAGYCGTAPLAHNAVPALLSSSVPSSSLMEQPALLFPDWWKVNFFTSPHTLKGRSPCSFKTSLPEGENKKMLQIHLCTPNFFFLMCFTGASNCMDKSHLTFSLHKKQMT